MDVLYPAVPCVSLGSFIKPGNLRRKVLDALLDFLPAALAAGQDGELVVIQLREDFFLVRLDIGFQLFADVVDLSVEHADGILSAGNAAAEAGMRLAQDFVGRL